MSPLCKALRTGPAHHYVFNKCCPLSHPVVTAHGRGLASKTKGAWPSSVGSMDMWPFYSTMGKWRHAAMICCAQAKGENKPEASANVFSVPSHDGQTYTEHPNLGSSACASQPFSSRAHLRIVRAVSGTLPECGGQPLTCQEKPWWKGGFWPSPPGRSICSRGKDKQPQLESHLSHWQLGDLRQITSPLWSSSPSSVKWSFLENLTELSGGRGGNPALLIDKTLVSSTKIGTKLMFNKFVANR